MKNIYKLLTLIVLAVTLNGCVMMDTMLDDKAPSEVRFSMQDYACYDHGGVLEYSDWNRVQCNDTTWVWWSDANKR